MIPVNGNLYESLLGYEVVRDDLFPAEPRRMPELELQARWFAGEYGFSFLSTAGARVEVIHPGYWNHEAGPDFCDAVVSIDGAPAVRGGIELDWDLRDWESHGHSSNPGFENVVLHLFVERGSAEMFTRDRLHRNIPQVQIQPGEPAGVVGREADPRPGRCAPLLADDASRREVMLEAAAQFRIHRKGRRLRALAEAHGPDEALYQAVAEAFGYKSNRLPFMVLSQRLPIRRLLKRKESIEPLLFGVSGFLELQDASKVEGDSREFLRAMWQTWWQLRGEHERLILAPTQWKSSGQRPQNHPQRRLAALAATIRDWRRLRQLTDNGDIAGITRFFRDLSDPYWDHHYTLTSAASGKRIALAGASRIQELLLNVFFPWILQDRPGLWSEYRAIRLELDNVRASIAAARLFPGETLRESILGLASNQQALLQVYEDFCLRDGSGCAQCPFPERVACMEVKPPGNEP